MLYARKIRKNARIPATMPYEVTFLCGHRAIYRFTMDQIQDASETVSRLETQRCASCIEESCMFHSIDDIKRANDEANGRFFSRENMRFQKSRLSSVIFPTDCGGAYFVTSEEYAGNPPFRQYSVRFAQRTGRIYPMSLAPHYDTLKEAQSEARRLQKSGFRP